MKSASVRIVVVALCLAIGCTARSEDTASGRSDRNVLTQEQLSATNFTDIYSALEKLRPEWLTSRGPSSISDATPTLPSIYMNGQRLGSAEYLREVRVLDVTSVRYWSSGPAAAKFGMGHPRGVIELIRQ